jgi:hypothetical protein
MRVAHETLGEFMHEQVADRVMEVRSGALPKDDVFSMLVCANEADDNKLPLNDTELVSRSLSGLYWCLVLKVKLPYGRWEICI